MSTTQHMGKCGKHHTEEELTRHMTHLQNQRDAGNVQQVAPTELYSLKIKYVVIPYTTAAPDMMPMSQIQAQHDMLNLHYPAYQGSGGLTNTTNYPYFNFDTIMGNPQVIFEPYISSQLTQANGYSATANVLYMNVPASPPVNGYDSVPPIIAEYQSQGGVVEPGVIIVFITRLLNSGGMQVLGVTESIPAAITSVDVSTVGSSSVLGSGGASSGQGKTLIHELGHCFGLVHPFSYATCSDPLTIATQAANPQSPLQINPNFYTSFTDVNGGSGPTTGNGLDNRGRDYWRYCYGNPNCNFASSIGTTPPLNPGDAATVAPYSCLNTINGGSTVSTTQGLAAPWETFMIFMDYGEDTVMLGFPSATCTTIQHTIQTGVVPDKDSNGNPEPNAGQPLFSYRIVNAGTTIVPPVTVVPSDSSSSFPTWAIVVIAVVGGLLLIALIAWGASKGSKGRGGGSSRNSTAYATPFAKRVYV